ncbi:unnamed protein product [Closterium sp. NIES-53]
MAADSGGKGRRDEGKRENRGGGRWKGKGERVKREEGLRSKGGRAKEKGRKGKAKGDGQRGAGKGDRKRGRAEGETKKGDRKRGRGEGETKKGDCKRGRAVGDGQRGKEGGKGEGQKGKGKGNKVRLTPWSSNYTPLPHLIICSPSPLIPPHPTALHQPSSPLRCPSLNSASSNTSAFFISSRHTPPHPTAAHRIASHPGPQQSMSWCLLALSPSIRGFASNALPALRPHPPSRACVAFEPVDLVLLAGPLPLPVRIQSPFASNTTHALHLLRRLNSRPRAACWPSPPPCAHSPQSPRPPCIASFALWGGKGRRGRSGGMGG